MLATTDEIIEAALKLPDDARLQLLDRLIESLPDDLPGLSIHDPGFLEELNRRSREIDQAIPAREVWKQT